MKTRRTTAAVLFFALLSSTLALPAWSQQDDPATIQARARFKEGVDAYDKGKFEEARLAFLQAYTLKKHPAVLLNLAQSSARSSHFLDASRYFQQFLKDAETVSPQQRKDAEAGLADVRQRLGRIDVVAPAGTKILLDDRGVAGTAPMEPIDVEPGVHTLRSPTQTVTVTALAGQKVTARLDVASAPGAMATAPSEKAAAPEKTPPLADDAFQAKRTNALSPPENMTPVYIGLGVAGVGLVSTIVFAIFKADAQSKATIVANDLRAEADVRGLPRSGVCNDLRTPDFSAACATLRDNNDKVDMNATIANISAVVAGVGAVGALVWYVAAPKEDDPKTEADQAQKPKRPTLTPWMGWNAGGLTLTGEL